MTDSPPRPPAEVFATAKWIWCGGSMYDNVNLYVRARREFDLAGVPERVDLAISADQAYMLFVNGQLVGRGPARGYHYVWPYDQYDIAPFLVVGRNVIAVRAYCGGKGTFSYISQGVAGLIVACEIPFDGPDPFLLDTDFISWRVVREKGTAHDAVPMSLQTNPQEHHDARLDDADWTRIEFDQQRWSEPNSASSSHGGFGAPPWSSMSPRMIPNLRETTIDQFTLLGGSSGKSVDVTYPIRDVAQSVVDEGLSFGRVPSESVSTLNFSTRHPGEYQSYLIDLGKLRVGNYTLEVKGAQGGEVIDMMMSEAAQVTDAAARVYHTPGGNSNAAFATRLIAKAGDSSHTFFHLIGHRVAVVRVRNLSSPLKIQLTLHESLYPLEIEGRFETSDALLNDIWNTSVWTQRVCMLDAYVDTPHREQAQWWGDARVQARNTFHLADDARLLRRGIDCIALQQLPNGLTYGHAPTIAHNCILPDFTLTWMLTLWDHYWQTGSTEAFLQHEHRVFAALEYFIDHIDDDHGLVAYDPRYWLFLDWTPIQKNGFPALLSLWLLNAIDRLIVLCDLLKRKQLKLSMLQVKAWLLNALEQLVDQDTGLMHDGILPDGTVNPACSVHTQTLAILSNVVPEAHQNMLTKSLLPFTRGQATPEISPSAFWITYTFDAVAQLGHPQDVVDCIKRRWQPMIASGTTWEQFDFLPAQSSLSHAWSAHPISHLMQIIGGVRQTSPNWKRVRFNPLSCDMDFNIAYPTPHGLIRVKRDRKVDAKPVLTLPAGVEIDG